MNWYKLLTGDDNRLSNFFMATDYELVGRDSYDMLIGLPISDWNQEIRLWSKDQKSDGAPDDILANTLGWPIVSPRLREALTQYEIGIKNIQFLPVQIYRSTGEKLAGFSIANVITRVPALDREHSFLLSIDDDDIDPLTNQPNVTGIGKAALKAEALSGHDAIRLLEFFPSLFVSARVANLFVTEGFTGATFNQVSVVQ